MNDVHGWDIVSRIAQYPKVRSAKIHPAIKPGIALDSGVQ